MSTWNARLRLKFCQRLPCRPDSAFLSRCYAESNRFDGFESFQAIEDLLVALRILHYQFGSAVHGEDNWPVRLLQSAHEGARFPLEVGEWVDIPAQINHDVARILKASLTMLSGFEPTQISELAAKLSVGPKPKDKRSHAVTAARKVLVMAAKTEGDNQEE